MLIRSHSNWLNLFMGYAYVECKIISPCNLRTLNLNQGYNEYGELGLGHVSDPTDAILPTKIEGALKNVKVTQLTCGSDHVLAITNKGELFRWDQYHRKYAYIIVDK